MIGLLAAAGTSKARVGPFRSAVEEDGRTCHTITPSESTALITLTGLAGNDFLDQSGKVVAHATDGVRTLAVFGSGVSRLSRGAAGLLERYREEGVRVLDGAPQDLALVVADSDRGSLTLGASSGHHRWFGRESEDGLLASTALSLLGTAIGPDLTIDRSYEDFLLGFGFLPDGRTTYSDVRILSAGNVWRWPGLSRTSVRPDAPTVPDALGDARRLRGVLHDLFFEILEDQTEGRERHAVLLGGFDSALVVAGLRHLGHQVDTYTFSFGDRRYEQRHAASVSAELGARHHWVDFTPAMIGDGLEQFANIFSQPGPQPHYQLHTTITSCRIADDGHDHIFTGDGCDSAFLGYPTVNLRSRLLRRAGALPGPLRSAALRLSSLRSVERNLGHVARVARFILRTLELPWPARGHLPTQYLDSVSLDRLRLGPRPTQAESVTDIRLRLANGLDDLDPVRLAFHGNGLIGQSGSKVDGAVTASGLPQFSPYRDPRLRAFIRRLPSRILPTRNGKNLGGKPILFEMAREYNLLPEYVISMPKQSPVDSPIDRWYAGPLRSRILTMMSGLPFDYNERYVREILSPKWPEELFREHVALGHHAFQAIGILCSYAAFTSRAE